MQVVKDGREARDWPFSAPAGQGFFRTVATGWGSAGKRTADYADAADNRSETAAFTFPSALSVKSAVESLVGLATLDPPYAYALSDVAGMGWFCTAT